MEIYCADLNKKKNLLQHIVLNSLRQLECVWELVLATKMTLTVI